MFAMMAKGRAAMANTWARLTKVYMKKMPHPIMPYGPAKARKHKASDVTLSFWSPKFITSKNANGANVTSQNPAPCMRERYNWLAAA